MNFESNNIHFILMVNKQGQTRLAKYFNSFSVRERVTLEGELIRKCLSRTENQCSFLEHRQYKVVYRRYASLYFIIGVENNDDVVSPKLHRHAFLMLMFNAQYEHKHTCKQKHDCNNFTHFGYLYIERVEFPRIHTQPC